MNLLSYTTYDEVRAILGVAPEEVLDNELSQPAFATRLQMELDTVHENLSAGYATVAAKDALVRTVSEQKFYDILRLYASYSFAGYIGESIATYAFQSATDGKAENTRTDEILSVLENIKTAKSQILPRLRLAALGAGIVASFVTSVSTPRIVAGVGLAVNPVTGAAT